MRPRLSIRGSLTQWFVRRAPAKPKWPSCWRTLIATSTLPWSTRWRGFATISEVDLWDVIAAASTKPFGFQPFRPGPGVGGHCIPIDPNYLSHRVRARLGYPFRFVELAQEINAAMPSYIARRIQDQLNRDGKPLLGSMVLLLGVTYKPDIADTRQSPAIPLARTLIDHGASLRFHDPLVKQFSVSGQDIPRVDHVEEALGEADICVLLQNHREYDIDAMSALSRRFFDTRGVARPAHNVQLL